jgi:transposase, IS6 family
LRAVTGSGGRLHFGIVAGIKSERWPTSNRNPRPDCVGIRTARHTADRSSEDPMQEPALRAGQWILAIAGAVDPVALTRIVLEAEIVTHRRQLRITLPPFAEHTLGAVGALHPPAHAAPGEGSRWVIRKQRYGVDRLGMVEQSRRFCCKLCCWRTSHMIEGNDRAGVSMGLGNCFKGRQFTAEAILWAVRWYLMFPVSYRDLELMLLDRGVEVDHTTIFRWIQAYAAELEKRIRPHLRMSNGSWRVDETYVRVKGRWTYLYRAVDSRGQTIDFLLAARRDTAAAKRFFRKAMAQPHVANPRTLTVDKNPAYPRAVADMKSDGQLSRRTCLRQCKYLNNIVEQDHRRIKRLVRPGLGFGSFHTARRTLAGFETMAMMRKGQLRQIDGHGMRGQAIVIADLFDSAA